ncbi:MAG: phosphoribosylanthranilate isomerase [bacterium]|nr:phosphoribosylanthranilate isomerase [bacterium]
MTVVKPSVGLSPLVKICGVTTLEDGIAAADAGAAMIGLNFYRKSPRYIAPEEARTLTDAMRARLGANTPLFVGVFVNEVVGRISITMEEVGLNFAQLSGDESIDMLKELRGIAYKALRPRSVKEAEMDADYYGAVATDPRIPSLLVDAHHPSLYGGTGDLARVEIALALKAKTPRLMLAGGLTPDNVREAVNAVQPWAVDVASGVEGDTPGRKDHEKLRAFIQAVNGAHAP